MYDCAAQSKVLARLGAWLCSGVMGHDEASCRQFGGSRANVGVSHYAPETNGVVERFHRLLKCEHLCQRKIDDDVELAHGSRLGLPLALQ